LLTARVFKWRSAVKQRQSRNIQPDLDLPEDASVRSSTARLVTNGNHDTYRALPSTWDGEDSELLVLMLAFYPRTEAKRILDATVNGGRFWKDGLRSVLGMDIDIRHRPGVVGDNMRMPFRDSCFDVVVYDPPHVPNQGQDRQKDFVTRFGLGLKSFSENGYNFSHLYRAFAVEAHRVLRPEGVLFCKITDYIHNHRYQWAHIEMVNAASAVGLRACDCIVKIRKGPIVDPKWKQAHHARHQHCYWLVFRKSQKCE
jgi:SAM-dependent methyltransferase